jgi:hypothetical protein
MYIHFERATGGVLGLFWVFLGAALADATDGFKGGFIVYRFFGEVWFVP